MDNINKLNNGKPTIGVLIGSLSSFYQEGIMSGANEAAKELDYNIIGFAGGPYYSPDPNAHSRESIFELVNDSYIDAVIIPVSAHCRYLNKSETQDFIDKFKGIPLINIGSILPGYTNIMPDYTPGLKQTIEHFVNDHGYKKIALFRGPKFHSSSNTREQIYKDTLTSLGIPVCDQLIILGDLRLNAAKAAVEELLDVRKQTCDAIICVNDSLALGVIDVLKERDIRIPEDIAISGSLGNPAGIFSDPPLATVIEPLFELGYEAIQKITDIFAGLNSPVDVLIPTKMVLRTSCGCFPKSKPKPELFEQIKATTYNSIQDEWHELYEASIIQAYKIIDKHRSLKDSKYIDTIMKLFYDSVESLDFSCFFDQLRDYLESIFKTPAIIPWIELLTNFEYTGIELFRIVDDTSVLENFLETIALIKDEVTLKAITFQSSETDFYINFSRGIINNLNASFDLNAVRTYAVDLLDLTDLYITVFDKDATDLNQVTNLIAVKNKKSVVMSLDERHYDSKLLIPQSVDLYQDRYSLIVFPLSFRKKTLGFLILNLSKKKGSAYENMQAIISTSLNNEIQIQELKEAESRFSDIAHSTSDWLWETDNNNLFTYSSNSVENVIGYTSSEIIGQCINNFTNQKQASFYNSMKSQETLINVETWFTHKNGGLVCLLISTSPIINNGYFIGYRGVFKDITAQKLQDEKIKTLAYYDLLTGLPNRTLFQEKLNNTVLASKRKSSKFALLFLDIDRFKYVNDSMGHATGDKLLKIVADMLKDSIREIDFVARLGGDEFTIVLSDLNNDYETVQVAQRILNKMIPPIKFESKQLYITMSIGIAIYPNDGHDASSLLINADAAMYKAKSRGRNRYIFYDKNIEAKNTSRIQVEELIHHSLNEHNFFIQYQPKINTFTKEITGFEALVRIKTSDSKIIYPDVFIKIAEDLGLINHIDELVLKLVCQQIKHWQDEGLQIKPISVNLSPTQLKNREIYVTYLSIVNLVGIDPKWIQLEIIENALISNEELAFDILTDFKKSGFTIALDDFGTGYSSLSCINMYPIDTIKIDKSFINDILISKSHVSIVKAVVQIAGDLNLNVIAEGVETLEQYELVKSLKCSEIQGYYFSKPLNVDLIHQMLIDGKL